MADPPANPPTPPAAPNPGQSPQPPIAAPAGAKAAPSTSAPAEPPKTAPGPGPVEGTLLDAGKKVLVAALTAVGSLGFVTLTGGAILWIRFQSADLPADQAVAAVSETELLTVGAAALTGFVLVGLLAVTIAYLFDRRGVPSHPTRVGLALLVSFGALTAIAFADPVGQCVSVGVIAVAIWFVTTALVTVTLSQPYPTPAPPAPLKPPPTDPDTGAGLRRWLRRLWRRIKGQWLNLWEGQPQASTPVQTSAGAGTQVAPQTGPATGGSLRSLGRKFDASEPHQGKQVPQDRQLTIAVWILLAVIAAATGAVLYLSFPDQSWVAMAFGIAVLLSVACLGIARANPTSFRWYGVSLFLAVAVFGATVVAIRGIQEPELQAIAAVGKDEAHPHCGIYVSETEDRLYMARLPIPQTAEDKKVGEPIGSGQLFWLPKANVVGWSIGPLQTQDNTDQTVKLLAENLINERRQQRSETETKTFDSGEGPATIERTVTRTFAPRAKLEDFIDSCTVFSARAAEALAR